MTQLIRAEILKARATRSTWIIGAITLLFCALWTVVTAITDPDLPAGIRVENVYQNAQQGYLFALILGILAVSSEYRHQTISWSFLVTPRRGRVLTAKLLGLGLVVGAVLALACVLATVAAAVPSLLAQGLPLTTAAVPAVLLGSALSTILYTVLGVAIGALIRNQVAAVAIAFVWFYYAEFLLIWFVPAVGRWVPSGAAKAISGWHLETGTLLPAWAGGAVLLGYTGLLCVAAHGLTLRRDVT